MDMLGKKLLHLLNIPSEGVIAVSLEMSPDSNKLIVTRSAGESMGGAIAEALEEYEVRPALLARPDVKYR